MSSGKYSKGGKKLGDAISLSQHKSASDGNKSSGDNPGSSSSTLSSNENESEGRLAEKKSRKRKKETPPHSAGQASSPDLPDKTASPEKRVTCEQITEDTTAALTPGRDSGTAPLLRPSYLQDDGAKSSGASADRVASEELAMGENEADDAYPPVRRPIFIPFASDSAVAFLPHGSSFAFKGKVLLQRVVNGRLHCLGVVFGTNDERPLKMFSPDSTSLLTVEDFNDGLQDADAKQFHILMRQLFVGKIVENGEELLRKLTSTYSDYRVFVNGRSTAPSVAIFERLDDALCDSLSSFSGQFRQLFAERRDGLRKKAGNADSNTDNNAVEDNTEKERSLENPDIYAIPSIGITVFHFPDDDDEEMDPAPAPWQRPTHIPTEHWSAIERIVDDGGGGGMKGTSPTISPSPLKVVVIGGKNCGKSTFARVVVNALLCAKRAPEAGGGGLIFPDGLFFLDLDVGQCEFTPSSFVSLVHVRRPMVGPPFSHLAKLREDDNDDDDDNRETPRLVSMAFGGGNSPGTAPSFFMQAVKRVYRAYEDHPLVKKWRGRGGDNNNDAGAAQVPPLIINTMGWNKGLGLSLMVDTLRLLGPSHVVQLDSSSVTKNFPPITNDFVILNPGWKSRVEKHDGGGEGQLNGAKDRNSNEHELITVFSPVGHLALEGFNKYRPPDLRLLALLAHWFIEDKSVATPTLTTSTSSSKTSPNPIPAILSIAPYKIPLRRLTLHVVNSKLKNSQLLYAFNGSLVALCVETRPRCSVAPKADPAYLGPRFFAAGASAVGQRLEAVGLGLVRGVDLDTHHVYICTFVPSSILSRVDTLILGDMDLPAEIKHAKLPTQILPTRSIEGGIYCERAKSTSAVADDSDKSDGNQPLPYMTVDHKTTIGSGGLGNTHKAPFRENKPGSVGRRNDLLKW